MEGIRDKHPHERVSVHRFTKDGSILVEIKSFVRKDGKSGYAESGYFADIRICSPGTTDIRRLTQADEGQYYTPIGFTPDGRSTYFRLYDRRQGPEAATSTFGTVSLDDGSAKPVVRGEVGIVRAWWSPTGRELLYVAERAEAAGARLMIAEADGAHPRTLFTFPNLGMDRDFSVTEVQWSGDGTQAWITDSEGLHWFARKHFAIK